MSETLPPAPGARMIVLVPPGIAAGPYITDFAEKNGFDTITETPSDEWRRFELSNRADAPVNP